MSYLSFLKLIKRSRLSLQGTTLIPIVLIALMLITSLGVIYVPDSNSYINLDLGSYEIVRPILYPVIIDVMQYLFEDSWPIVFICVQFIFGVSAIFYFENWSREKFNLSFSSCVILNLVLFTPYIIPNLWIGNTIASEGLAYPLFLLFVVLIAKHYTCNSSKIFKFYLLTGTILFLLILTRKQFFFLCPFFIILPIFFKHERTLFNIMITVGLVFTILLSTSYTERIANAQRFGAEAGSADIGMQFIVAQLYLSPPSHEEFLSKPKEKEFFQRAQAKLREKQASRYYMQEDFKKALGLFGGFFHNFNPILHSAIDSSEEIFENKSITLEQKKVADEVMLSVAAKLMKHNKVQLLKLFTFNFVHGIGGDFSVGFALPIIVSLLIFLCLIQIICSKTDSPFNTLLIIALLLHLANIVTISIVEPTMLRYTFYTWSVLICVIILRFLSYEKGDKSNEFS